MVSLMACGGNLRDEQAFADGVFAREAQTTTGVGGGIAVPHCKSAAVSAPGLAAMVVPDGTEFDSLDGKPVQLLFLIAAPDGGDDLHVMLMAELAGMLLDESFCRSLIHARTPEEFLRRIDAAQQQRGDRTGVPARTEDSFRVLAVTACPTGIAHTYMAAEALREKAREMGVSIKVETDGSGGVENALTAEEIASCDCVIVAADKNVEDVRFAGKPVVFATAGDGIRKPAELLEKALSGKAPVYYPEAAPGSAEPPAGDGGNALHQLYKHVMNGVSHMLPFVIGGGILTALAFLFDGAHAGTALFGAGNSLSLALKTVGGLAMGMMYPVLAGYIAMSIADRPALMPGMVGGLLAAEGVSNLPQADWVSSGFFGALIAGFAAGYLMLGLKRLLRRLPKALEGTKPILLYPVLGILIIGALMVCLVNPPVGRFNLRLEELLDGLQGGKVVLSAILGAMMAIDFGGPVGKVAYVFGTAALAVGDSDIMAAVMVAGMAPPIATALACTFGKRLFTEKERQATLTNYILGLCFISEGAIPFAAADPLRVIPSCMAGSALAGALSMAFGCCCPAPHGGIFIIGIITRPLLFLLALLAGSVLSAVLMCALKTLWPAKT